MMLAYYSFNFTHFHAALYHSAAHISTYAFLLSVITDHGYSLHGHDGAWPSNKRQTILFDAAGGTPSS